MMELRRGEARTDRQGRFVVSLPPRCSELRAGYRASPVQRDREQNKTVKTLWVSKIGEQSTVRLRAQRKAAMIEKR